MWLEIISLAAILCAIIVAKQQATNYANNLSDGLQLVDLLLNGHNGHDLMDQRRLMSRPILCGAWSANEFCVFQINTELCQLKTHISN